jgi:hypothetical protein
MPQKRQGCIQYTDTIMVDHINHRSVTNQSLLHKLHKYVSVVYTF